MSVAIQPPRRNLRSIKPARHGDAPPLRNGDHLSIPESEHRYEAMPGLKGAEQIEGIVVMPSPVRYIHGSTHSLVHGLLSRYASATPVTSAVVCASLRLDGQNEYQPDILLRIKSGPLAGSKVAPDGLLAGSPEFAAEIAICSADYDLHEKKAVYQRALVQEYMVWQVMDARIHWYALRDGRYVEMEPRADGVIASGVFPGLCLDIRAMLAGDETKALRTLEKGIESASHQAFIKKLRSSNKS